MWQIWQQGHLQWCLSLGPIRTLLLCQLMLQVTEAAAAAATAAAAAVAAAVMQHLQKQQRLIGLS
jgi:hypothetical protein